MKSALRLVDYLGHMQQAAQQAVGSVDRMDKNTFIADRLTQQACSSTSWSWARQPGMC